MAAKLESDWAALTVVKMMPDVATIRYAIRYAVNVNRQGLAQRIGQIALEMEEREEGVTTAESADEKENVESEQTEEADADDEDVDDVMEVLG